jgi:hypothetical protein
VWVVSMAGLVLAAFSFRVQSQIDGIVQGTAFTRCTLAGPQKIGQGCRESHAVTQRVSLVAARY